MAYIDGKEILFSPNINITQGGSITVDAELSKTSENPVQNKVITSVLLPLMQDMDELKPYVSELEEEINIISQNMPSSAYFNDGATITVADECFYWTNKKISSLIINYPEGSSFICGFSFTLADEGIITITLPESKYIGDIPTFANGETWELNIRNGVIVGGKIE